MNLYICLFLGISLIPKSYQSASEVHEIGDLKDVLVGGLEEQLANRRSVGAGKFRPGTVNTLDRLPHCTGAIRCVHSGVHVCGYEDGYGFAFFQDLCSLLKFNCYRGREFAATPYCFLTTRKNTAGKAAKTDSLESQSKISKPTLFAKKSQNTISKPYERKT